jgi:hypothetical protein
MQGEMDSKDITTKQAEQIHASLSRLANYLYRLTDRMERCGFPPDDPLYQKTKSAYDAVCSLLVSMHYHSCATGVGRPPRE